MVVFGTRPEAIKIFPVVRALREMPELDVRICVTGQHRELLDQVMTLAGMAPDIDLAIMRPGQSLDALFSRLVMALGRVFDQHGPDRILVHGDTLTTMAAALAAYFRRIPVGHVEAGLRSGDRYRPWPEEVNRRVATLVADLHFAPTQTAARALQAENVDAGTIHITGNTGVDALLWTRRQIAADPRLAARAEALVAPFAGKRIIVVTAHRRETIGAGLTDIAAAIARLAQQRPDIGFVCPLHPNPDVRTVLQKGWSGFANILLTAPLDYPDFVRLLDRSTLVLTDSGGIQEEAPSLGKPVLVMRDVTERMEAIAAGTACLVGVQQDHIIRHVNRLLDDEDAYSAMARAHNPYGDGQAAARIAAIIADAV